MADNDKKPKAKRPPRKRPTKEPAASELSASSESTDNPGSVDDTTAVAAGEVAGDCPNEPCVHQA